MALTLEQLQAKRDSLISDIALARSEMSDGDKTTRWQAVDQMEKALARIDSEISSVTTTSTRPRQIRMATSKGL
jgi:hypothetical protein